MMSRRAIFVINLLQDVNVVRPLVFLAARDFNLRTEFLVTEQFIARDTSGIWLQELREISAETGAPIIIYTYYREALQMLQGEAGILIAASESDLSAHTPTHELFRFAPSSFLKITLQHGFECVGFLQSHDHDLAHGRNVTFAADLVCGWCEGSRLTAMAPSQRDKLYVTGPTAVLQTSAARLETNRPPTGLICENLHSVRLNTAGDFKTEFMTIFEGFCQAADKEEYTVALRPHPGGQYVLKHKVQLPANVTLSNNPIYKTNLAQYAYGISAPSSIIIDMILAGIPVAVWRDASGIIDTSNYDGLSEVRSLDDWLRFAREAIDHPERFIELQQRFLEHQKILSEPAEVYRRFAKLLAEEVCFQPSLKIGHQPAERIMFIANGHIPTLQLSFSLPLAPLVRDGELALSFLVEPQIKETFGKRLRDKSVEPWIAKRLASFRPTLMVFCRYNGPHFEYLIEWARNEGIPTIYHIDDDLLNVPLEIGEDKYRGHNDPRRRAAVRYLLDNADLIYTSTRRLAERLKVHGIAAPAFAGEIYCAGTIIEAATNRSIRKVGYMGFDHAHDFAIVVPALIEFLRRNPTIHFELFGSIPKPPELDEFGDRVSVVPPVRNYEGFLKTLADLSWDIGICPLVQNEFNLMKANTKWVEYTSVGAAVIASRGTVYDECCADGCGVLASTHEEWVEALQRLAHSPVERFEQVLRAQAKLEEQYSVERLRRQLFRSLQ